MRHTDNYSRIVIKIGTTSLTYPNGMLNLRKIEQLCTTLTDLRNQGKEIVLVSSGAIAVGADKLGLSERPRGITGKQAASAVGQAMLMQIYHNFFSVYNQKVAQILLTKDVIDNSERKFNACNTFSALLTLGVIPIVNENDTISIDELDFSDNDSLSAFVACLVEADLLILLSDINGLYNKDPNINEDATLVTYVDKVDQDIENLAGTSSSSLGTGGMISKINAAKRVMRHNIDMVIASGEDSKILYDILEGKDIGTLFKS